MYGAILGDMIGSPYEFDRGDKTKDFPFFDRGATFTDDSVMTIAVAEALAKAVGSNVIDDEAATKDLIIDSMHKWGHRYPNAGYGGRFYSWLRNSEREPYNSWGNGSAMRVSSVGWMFGDIETTRRIARWTAEVTHNHPEGVKGAEATASAIFMARTGASKDEIKEYVVRKFGYDLSRTCDEIRPGYSFDVSCQGSVPEAIRAFLDGEDFEDVIRTAVSLGGDTDTIGAMAGSIAEAFYGGVSDELMTECENRIPPDMRDVLLRFHHERRADLLGRAINLFNADKTEESLITVLYLLRGSVLTVPCNVIMSERDQKRWEEILLGRIDDPDSLEGLTLTNEDEMRMVPDILTNGDNFFFPAFTSVAEMGEYGEAFSKVQKHILEIIGLAKNNEKEPVGIVINAFSEPFVLTEDIYHLIEDDIEGE